MQKGTWFVPLDRRKLLSEDLIVLSRVTPTSAEAFIVRLYREKNQNGFLKAFCDQPEHITSGMSPLRTIMKELQLRKVYIYPRYVGRCYKYTLLTVSLAFINR